MSASSKKTSLKCFDIQKELISLIPLLHRNTRFPRALFEFDPKIRSKSKFAFPCADPGDFYYCRFYGDAWMTTFSKFSRKMIVKRKVQRKPPSAVSPHLIRGIITECIDSVEDVDKEFATLKVIIGRVYFEGQTDIPINDQTKFFEGRIPGDQYYVPLPTGKLAFTHGICEWTSPNNTLQLLTKNGFSVTSREPLDGEMFLSVRGGHIRARVEDGKFLYLGNNLTLNPTTLAVKSWRLQNWYPLNYYIMHGFPSSNDIIIRTNVKRHATLAELSALKGPKLPGLMATDEDSGSFIHRTDIGFKLVNKYENVKCITEIGSGERIHLQYKNVACYMNLAPMRYFRFNAQNNALTFAEDQSCECIIEFSLTENRSELIEAITRLSLVLFSKANDDNELALTISPQYIMESDGTRVSWLDAQTVIRLQIEQGDLYQLLGLGDNPSRNECEKKATALKRLLLRSRQQEWFEGRKFDFNELMEKLTCACQAHNFCIKDHL